MLELCFEVEERGNGCLETVVTLYHIKGMDASQFVINQLDSFSLNHAKQ
jgi:hypothetical protein